MDRSHSPPPTSSAAVCVWIPLFALRCEEARRPELVSQPGALLAADAGRRVVWQGSPLARHAGGRPGMTGSQAIGLRSGERRVGEEGRSRWAADHLKKKKVEE